MTDHKPLIQGLRDLADWLDTHPECPSIWNPHLQLNVETGADDTDAGEATRLARLLTPCRKDWDENLLTLARAFGPVELRAYFWRSQVCTKRVVATREVPEHMVPAYTEEVVEWDCHPLLREEVAP